jgi:hypothetical protein
MNREEGVVCETCGHDMVSPTMVFNKVVGLYRMSSSFEVVSVVDDLIDEKYPIDKGNLFWHST